MTTKVTATYTMTNILTGQEQSYFIVRNAYASEDQIITKFKKDLSKFPAYISGIMYVSSNIIISNYRGQILKCIIVN